MSTQYLYPNIDGSFLQFPVFGGGNAWAAVDDPVGSESTADRIYGENAVVYEYRFFGLTSPSPVAAINSVQMIVGAYEDAPASGGQVQMDFYTTGETWLDGSTSFTGVLNETPTLYSGTAWPTNPGTGLAWTAYDLENLMVRVLEYGTPASNPRVYCIRVKVEYVKAPEKLNQIREVLSRIWWFGSKPRDYYKAVVPASLGARLTVGTYLPVSYQDAVNPGDYGWGWKSWERQPLWIEGITPRPGTGTYELLLRDKRRVLFLDSAWSEHAHLPLDANYARLDVGNTRTFNRDSYAYFNRPSDNRVTRVDWDEEAHSILGDLHEAAATNLQTDSSFLRGSGATFTGWTAIGSGTVTEETDPTKLLWEASIVPRCPKLTAGNPITTDFKFYGTTTGSLTAGTPFTVSVDVMDNAAGAPLYCMIKRTIDNYYWNALGGGGMGAWQVGSVMNQLGWVADPGIWGRSWVRVSSVGTSASPIIVAVGVPTTGVAGQINWVGHIQVEYGYMTSRILTTSATESRAASRLQISNDTDLRCFYSERGAFKCDVFSYWAGVEAASAKTIFSVYYKSTDYEWLYYKVSPPPAGWYYERARLGAATIQAVYADSWPTKYTPTQIAVRWTGADGELGLAPYTASIFVDGTKGTDATGTDFPAHVSPSYLEIGSRENTYRLDGGLRNVRVLQYVPADEEMARP